MPIIQYFPYKNHCECHKKLASRVWSVLFTLTYFYFLYIYSPLMRQKKVLLSLFFLDIPLLNTKTQWHTINQPNICNCIIDWINFWSLFLSISLEECSLLDQLNFYWKDITLEKKTKSISQEYSTIQK